MGLPTAPAAKTFGQVWLKTIPIPACFKGGRGTAAQAIYIYSKTFQLHLDYDYPRRI